MTNPDGDLEDEEAACPFGGAKLDTPQRTSVTRHRAGLVDDAVVEGVGRVRSDGTGEGENGNN